MQTRQKKEPQSLWRDLAREAAKYIVTGLIGASAVLLYTCYRRLPGRSLTISPGGARVVIGSSVTCKERQFIAETLNAFLTDEIRVPPCNTLLDQDRRQLLKEDLERAYMTWHSQRTVYFEESSTQLHDLESQRGISNAKLRGLIIGIIGSFRYIANELPPGLEGSDLLKWATTRVDGQLSTFRQDEANIRAILSAVSGGDQKRSVYQLELFFLATNMSDVEYYVPTRAALTVTQRSKTRQVPIQLEQYGETHLPIQSLRFVPVQPGVGQLLRFSTPLSANAANDFLLAVKMKESMPAKFTASLPTGTVSSKQFDLIQFMQ